MLGDAGSIASLAGAAISLLGLGFAILQIAKLRGETRAARVAAEAAERAIGRELAITELLISLLQNQSSDSKLWLERAVLFANDAVHNKFSEAGGTTLSAVLITGNRKLWRDFNTERCKTLG